MGLGWQTLKKAFSSRHTKKKKKSHILISVSVQQKEEHKAEWCSKFLLKNYLFCWNCLKEIDFSLPSREMVIEIKFLAVLVSRGLRSVLGSRTFNAKLRQLWATQDSWSPYIKKKQKHKNQEKWLQQLSPKFATAEMRGFQGLYTSEALSRPWQESYFHLNGTVLLCAVHYD